MARFYAADIAAYNNGILHGVWVEASTDTDEMQAEISAMLRKSPCPNVTVPDYEASAKKAGFSMVEHNGTINPPAGSEARQLIGYTWQEVCEEYELPLVMVPSAEEYAIHDSEGLPSSFGEHCGLSEIAGFTELCEEHDHIDESDMADIVADFGSVDSAKEALEDNFCGIYDSFRDYADETADEMMACHGESKETEWLQRYFDYESFARDLSMDMNPIELASGKIAVFHS